MSATSPPSDDSRTYRGGTRLPAWDVDQLPEPPAMRWSPAALIGPGLMMAGAAIGGGEWLTGPRNTALYGGALMWLAGLSIFLQVFYNLEVIRYAVYCGESIFVGIFRMWPGPRFWTLVYLAIDFFGLWPYLSASAAVPLAAAFLGHVPAVLPSAYDANFKEARVVAFAEDNNIEVSELETVVARQQLRAELSAELVRIDWQLTNASETDASALHVQREQVAASLAENKPFADAASDNADAFPDSVQQWRVREQRLVKGLGIAIFLGAFIPLVFGGKIYKVLERIMTVKIVVVLAYLLFLGIFYVTPSAWLEAFGGFVFFSRDYLGSPDGVAQFTDWKFRLFPELADGKSLDWALLGAFVAVAGQGGLNNAQFSSYARDKGWGMGQKVGAIPSLVGGRGLRLPHTGSCFEVTETSLPRWLAWMRHIRRDQWLIWFTGCVLGMAIPSVISLDPQYRSTVAAIGDDAAAAATAYAISSQHGQIFWFLTLLCGFFVLAPNQISTTDGLARRWTEVMWTGNKWLQHLPASAVRYLYFGLLIAYGIFGVLVLLFVGGLAILKLGGCIMNFALGFSALHTLVVNNTLLPKPVRPSLLSCIGLAVCGVFFIAIAYVGAPQALQDAGLGWLIGK